MDGWFEKGEVFQNECVSVRFHYTSQRSFPPRDCVAEVLVFTVQLVTGAPQLRCLLMEAPLCALDFPQPELLSLKTYKLNINKMFIIHIYHKPNMTGQYIINARTNKQTTYFKFLNLHEGGRARFSGYYYCPALV